MPVPVIPHPSSAGTGPTVAPPTVAERTPDLEVRATWRPERYERIANGDCETDTSGWATTTGINAAGVSFTRVTTDGADGASTCARLVTDALADSGAHYDLGTSRYFADAGHSTLYVARVWLKRESGGRRARVTVGSEATSASRASVAVHLLDEWQEYLVPWRPQADVTDAQLAVTTADGRAVTVLVGSARLYAPTASQIDNGALLTDTTGWVTDGSLIAAAATSLTRIATDGIVRGGACGELVTPATADAGTDFALGDRLFRADMTHRLRLGLRQAATGGSSVRLRFGSLATPADRADQTVTLAGQWAWYTLDWTPSADRTDAVVSVANGAATAATIRYADVEVYETLDELAPDALEVTRGAAFDGTNAAGSMGGSLPDLDATYVDWNPASSLAGAIRPKVVPMFARATYGGQAHGLAWGRLASMAPDPYGKHAHFTTGDGLRDLAGAQLSRPFGSELSYAAARAEALDAAGVGAWQRELDPSGPESLPFFDGTDTSVSALQYLTDLNGATGSIHVAEPSAHANVGWVYTTRNRAELTDDGAQWFMPDDSRGPLPGAETRDDAIITAARRTYRGYEMLRSPGPLDTRPLPWGDEAADTGRGILAIGGDSAAYPMLTPYMAFTRPEFGSFEPPEPEVIISVRRERGKRRRTRRVRWTDPIFPLVVPAGTSKTIEVAFSVMVEGLEARWQPAAADVTVEVEPARALVTITAGDSDSTLTALAMVGRPWLPVDEVEVAMTASTAELGSREPVDLAGAETYLAGRAGAEGILRYHLWRYGRPRLRPVVTDALKPGRMLGIRPGDRLSMVQTRYSLPATVFAVSSVTHRIARPDALDWRTEYSLEELPSDAGPWATIGGGAVRGIGGTAETAY